MLERRRRRGVAPRRPSATTGAGFTPSSTNAATSGASASPSGQRQVAAFGQIGDLGAVHDALEEPQHVRRREHDRDAARRAPATTKPARNSPVRIRISPLNPARPGKSERRERAEHQRAGELGIARAQPAQPREVARLFALLDRAEREKQRRAEQPVRDDVDHRACERERRAAEHREQDQPQVRERAVRDDALRVALGERGERAVDQRDQRRARTSASARAPSPARGTAARSRGSRTARPSTAPPRRRRRSAAAARRTCRASRCGTGRPAS